MLYAQCFVIIKKGKIVVFKNDFDDYKISEHNMIVTFFKYVKKYFCREKMAVKDFKYHSRLIESNKIDFEDHRHKINLLKDLKPTHPRIEAALAWNTLATLAWHTVELAFEPTNSE